MKTTDLEALTDADIEQLIEDGRALLKSRADQRRSEAIEAARARLAEAGLTPQHLTAATRKRSAPSTAIASNQKFVNPENPKDVDLGAWSTSFVVQDLGKKGPGPTASEGLVRLTWTLLCLVWPGRPAGRVSQRGSRGRWLGPGNLDADNDMDAKLDALDIGTLQGACFALSAR